MEDIRDEKTKNVEEGVKPSRKEESWILINSVILKVYTRIGFVIKSYKYVWISILVLLIALYPSEIGSFIGSWINEFLGSLTKNLK
jgi:hypothetical protein